MAKLRISGFWIFAQYLKQRENYPGPFRSYVPIADTQWIELTEASKESWRNLARTIRNTDMCRRMKLVHKRLGLEKSEDKLSYLRDVWSAFLQLLYSYVTLVYLLE